MRKLNVCMCFLLVPEGLYHLKSSLFAALRVFHKEAAHCDGGMMAGQDDLSGFSNLSYSKILCWTVSQLHVANGGEGWEMGSRLFTSKQESAAMEQKWS